MSEDQDSWIIFGPNVGPRRLGRWVIYCEPDIILCIKGRLFVIEVKCSSVGKCIAPILHQAPVLCEPIIPNFRPTSYAQSICQLLCAKYYLDKFFNVKTMCAIIYMNASEKAPSCKIITPSLIQEHCPPDLMEQMSDILSRPLVKRTIVVRHEIQEEK